MSIPAALAATVAEHGDAVAVVDGELSLTYTELAEQVEGFAAALVASGIEPGDRVSIWAPNSARWIIGVLGIFSAGATLIPINTRFKGGEAADILRRGGVRALLTSTDFLGTDYLAMLQESGVELPALELVVVVGEKAPDGAITFDELVARATPESREVAARRAASVNDGDVSDILFTSGTTGLPKGVVQTHGRTLQVARDWVAMTGLRAGDRYLMVNPYFHMFGLKAGILASTIAGATMLPEPVFDAGGALERVARERISVLPGAPTIYQALLEHPTKADLDLSSLRVAVTGAADIPVELIKRIMAELPFSVVVTGYGLTEGGTATATSPDDDAETVATTVGRARPGFELRVVDAAGIDVAQGEPGEVLLRGGSIMSHYLDDPAATAAALSADGWLSTGDLGVIDDRGCLRIIGRSKDMFIVGGFNAYPAEIENALLRHPAIAQAAVIGVPDERLGEVGKAFVVLREGANASNDELVAWSREQMANYKAPRSFEVIDELPLNATGKVQKDLLRKWPGPANSG